MARAQPVDEPPAPHNRSATRNLRLIAPHPAGADPAHCVPAMVLPSGLRRGIDVAAAGSGRRDRQWPLKAPWREILSRPAHEVAAAVGWRNIWNCTIRLSGRAV